MYILCYIIYLRNISETTVSNVGFWTRKFQDSRRLHKTVQGLPITDWLKNKTLKSHF